jgi:hypothetical protein
VDVLSLVDGRRQTLLTNATFGRFVASADGTGFLTFIRAGATFAVPFDPVRLEVRGSALPVAEHVAYNPRVGSADLALSRSGTLIFRNEVKAHLTGSGILRSTRCFRISATTGSRPSQRMGAGSHFRWQAICGSMTCGAGYRHA